MHFLTCLLLGVLLLAEGAAELTVSPLRVLLAVALVTASPIVLAWLQGLELVRNRRLSGIHADLEVRALRQADIIHFAAWACASVSGVWLMQWPTLVKSTLGLRSWLLLDELLLIAPATCSLVASWVVFEQTTRLPVCSGEMEPANTPTSRSSLTKRFLNGFPATAFKLQHSLGLVLLPLLLLFAIRDLFGNQQGSAGSILLAGLAGLAGIALLYPFYLRMILPSEPLMPGSELDEFAGWRIRVWNTGHSVYNALVTGLIPGFQTIFISDGLAKHFPPEEVAAIVGHEAAHARRGHLLLRAVAIASPLLLLTAGSLFGFNLLEPLVDSINRFEPTGLLILIAATAGWAWGVIRPLSHWIEYDADVQAVCDPRTGALSSVRLQSLKSALLRLGHGFPEQFNRRTLLHPSLDDRLRRLRQLEAMAGVVPSPPVITNQPRHD